MFLYLPPFVICGFTDLFFKIMARYVDWRAYNDSKSIEDYKTSSGLTSTPQAMRPSRRNGQYSKSSFLFFLSKNRAGSKIRMERSGRSLKGKKRL